MYFGIVSMNLSLLNDIIQALYIDTQSYTNLNDNFIGSQNNLNIVVNSIYIALRNCSID